MLGSNVPDELDLDRFQTMVGHLMSLQYISFSKEDDNSLSHPYNQTLHIEVLIQNRRVKRVLIDGGASLNICSYSLITQLGFSEMAIDPRKKITIKAYDEQERSSKGTIVLPI